MPNQFWILYHHLSNYYLDLSLTLMSIASDQKWKKYVVLLLHKIGRYTKQQKLFVLYLFVLAFCMIILPVIRISPADPAAPSRLIFLISGSLGKTAIVTLLSLLILLGWNMSFRFKNFITAYFGFKENEYLFNFAFLWIITALYVSIGDTISIFTETTSIQVTRFGYNVVLLLLIAGLVLTLVSLIKKAQYMSKNKIVNIVESPEQRVAKAQTTVKGLFGGKDE
jgi:hypothetical protein